MLCWAELCSSVSVSVGTGAGAVGAGAVGAKEALLRAITCRTMHTFVI